MNVPLRLKKVTFSSAEATTMEGVESCNLLFDTKPCRKIDFASKNKIKC
jgi:hypothetical protein